MSAIDRLYRLVAVRGRLLTVVLVAVAVLALAGAATTYANPPVDVVTEERNVQTVSTSAATSALVTGETPLYDRGERLRDLPVYYFAASPTLDVAVTTSVPADQPVSVSQRLVIYTEARRDGERFWNETRLLAKSERTVEDGSAEMETTLNMSAVRTDVALRESAVGGIGTFAAEVRLEVVYETERYAGELTASAPLVFSENAYWLGSDLEGSRTHSETVRREAEQSPDTAVVGSLAGVGLLSLLGALAVVRFRRRSPSPDAIETDLVHDRYEEWISKGEFPTGTEKKHVRINSLEDLVDIAIDSNKRVVFDPEFAAYAVVDGDLIYYFSSDPLRIDSWLDV